MIRKHWMPGLMIAAGLIAIAMITAWLLLVPELDDVAQNGPLQSQRIQVSTSLPLLENILAAGISWNYDRDEFLISTDQPHGLFTGNIATMVVVDRLFSRVLYKLELHTDADLEGIAYIGNGEVAMISERGTLYFVVYRDAGWQLQRVVSVFTDNRKHKLASLAYDPASQTLYTAEKTGRKTIYQLSREGRLLDQFPLTVDGLPASRPFNLERDYTISGMAFGNEHLFVFSEAYSTIFKVSQADRQTVAVYGVDGARESAGLALRMNDVWLAGDYESYLPPPRIYKVALP